MIEILDSIDKQWLLALNNDYAPFWDGIMVGVSEKLPWVPLYLSLIYIIFRKWKHQGWWIILGLVLCVVIADQVASGILKETVKRFRPSHDPEIQDLVVIVNNYRGGLYGFASSHAANVFGLAMLSSLVFRNRVYTISIFIWAVIVAYSRIYLGVHYPGDILAGTIIGIASAWLIYWLLKKFRPVLFTDKYPNAVQTQIPILVLILSGVGMLAYTLWFFVPIG